jgi:hypothetical protein
VRGSGDAKAQGTTDEDSVVDDGRKSGQSRRLKSRPPNQIGWVISLEDWALIRHLHRSEGLSQRAIARQLGIARDTVAGALASDGSPKY